MENKIIRTYRPYETTLREVARQCKTDHHTVKRVLLKNGIAIVKGKRGSFTQEHKDNISKACKGRKTWSKGKKMTKSCILKNMKAHLKYDVSLEWLNEFDDIEKLKYLNNSISRKRDYKGFTTEIYQQFIEKFYNDKKFNDLFSKWKTTKDKWMKPSLDHIQAKCNGGGLLLDNLQFISWLENRAKVDIDQKDWDSIKTRIYEYF